MNVLIWALSVLFMAYLWRKKEEVGIPPMALCKERNDLRKKLEQSMLYVRNTK